MKTGANSLLLSILILSTLIIHSHAQSRDTAAVMDLRANNCPETLAKAATDILINRIYSTNLFTIVERSQMEAILKEQGFQLTGCTDEDCAVKIGKLLSVKKIFIGSLSKLERYILNVRIVDVESGRVESTYEAPARNEGGIEAAADTVARRLENDYYRGMYSKLSHPSVFFAAKAAVPIGSFADIAGTGYGAALDVNFNNLLFRNAVLTISLGVSNYAPAEDYIGSVRSAELAVLAGYGFKISRNFTAIPALGMGYMATLVEWDRDAIAANYLWDYEQSSYYDPLVTARLELDFTATHSLHLVLAPYYTVFFENSETGMVSGALLGVRLLF
jgi:hypothetical protein